jgi:hypothetical protein
MEQFEIKRFKSEAQFQAACVAWFHNTYPEHRGRLFAVQNNSENKVRGNNRKAMGLLAGVSDLVFISNKRVYFLELKMPKGTQSPAQKDFEDLVFSEGFDYYVVYTIEYFRMIINRMIDGTI